jgi:DNA polymerase-1
MVDKKSKTLVLIDGHALVHRAYHALPPLSTGQGELVNAVFGFTSILLKVLNDLKPDFIAASFDLAGPTFRHKEFEDYKATRVKAPDELYAQINRVKDVLAAFNIPVFEKEGFEADDIIGTLAAQACRNSKFQIPNSKIIIVTGDLDTLQLVNSKVNIFTLKKGIKDTVLYDEKAVQERFSGLKPKQMADYKGLKGDPSDNIPGVPGIGEKTAIELLRQYGSIESLYKEAEKQKKYPSTSLGVKSNNLFNKLLDFKEQAFFSKYLATIKTDVPLKFNLKDAVAHDFERAKAIKLFKDLGFYSLISRLPGAEEIKIKEEEKNLLAPPGAKNQTIFLDDSVSEKIEQALKQGALSEKLYLLEKKLAPVIAQMQRNGIKIDTAHLKKLGGKLNKRLAELEKKIYQKAEMRFNINSPQQLSEVLFDKLKVKTTGLKKTPGRVISTAAPELLKVKGQHAIVDLILEYRELMKLKTTYIDALPKLVAPDGRLHTTFDQLGTVTGRLSSKNPNLQNIPIKTELGNEIRKAFVADRGYKLLAADYSQIELRVVASLAKDRDMIRVFKEDKDIHTITAAKVFNVEPKDVSQKMRRVAKILNFGVIYGMSIHGFAQASGIEFEKAKGFIKEYFEDFSGVASYIERVKKEAVRNGFVQTIFGRKRFIPEINSSAWNLRAAAERMAINMPIQGTAADLIKMAMVQIADSGLLTGDCKLLLQVHDELVFEVAENKAPQIVQKIKEIMENIHVLAVPLKAEIEVGNNWGELEKI